MSITPSVERSEDSEEALPNFLVELTQAVGRYQKWMRFTLRCRKPWTISIQLHFILYSANNVITGVLVICSRSRPHYNIIYRDPKVPTMSKHLATMKERKNSFLRDRNLEQDLDSGRAANCLDWLG